MSEALRWQKSSYSAGDSDNDCLEIATTPNTLHLRESDHPGTLLSPAPATLRSLLASVKSARTSVSEALRWQKSSYSGGDEDTDCLEIAAAPGVVHLRESDAPSTTLSPAPTALHALFTAVKRQPYA